MIEGGPVASDASFVITEDDPDAPQGRREITRSAHPEPKLSLPAGTYYVTARLGDAEVRQRIAVGPGDTVKRTLVLGMARLEVTAAMEAGALPAGAGLLHRVLTLDGEPREVARSTSTPANFTLASGRYRIETLLGERKCAGRDGCRSATGTGRKSCPAPAGRPRHHQTGRCQRISCGRTRALGNCATAVAKSFGGLDRPNPRPHSWPRAAT